MKKIAIIGGGPAALMLASKIDTQKYCVTIYEQKKAVGRKFLVAGEGGLNLTFHSEIDELVSHYSPSEFMESSIRAFSNIDLINWLKEINIPTFVGSSSRVFPERGIKPIEVLNSIVEFVKSRGVQFQFNSTWSGWDEQGHLNFKNQDSIQPDISVFALGGSSWKVTGSDGAWFSKFQEKSIKTLPFRAANCGFEVNWNNDFIVTHEGKPLKNIALSFQDKTIKGELVISKFGLEGNAIYALSQKIQEQLETNESVNIHIDLKPGLSLEQVRQKYNEGRSTKVTEILKKELNLDRTSIALLKQFTDKESYSKPEQLTAAIKSLPITIHSAANIDEAISTLGGVSLDAIDKDFQLKNLPNSFVIGEMLDWYAPTGGYLLQGCFSMGYALAQKLNDLS